MLLADVAWEEIRKQNEEVAMKIRYEVYKHAEMWVFGMNNTNDDICLVVRNAKLIPNHMNNSSRERKIELKILKRIER